MIQPWWKDAVVYQVYPRSFMDANGDGIGDLAGLTSKLPYLQALGIDVIWLSPHYQSPNADNGYDISDYEAIMTEFGTMTDFDRLLAEIHRLGLKLIIDLVVNHSSDQHRWFEQARQSRDNPYRDYYIWQNPNSSSSPLPNNWISFFSGPAWTLDPTTQQYYLHLFTQKQPDLNWENETLRREIYKMMRFWLDKGVDGFRMDVISLISKPLNFADFPPERLGDLSYYANGPRVHAYLREMNTEVLSQYECMTVGEAFGVDSQTALDYVGQARRELQMIYHFDHAVPRDEHCFATPQPEFTLVQLKGIFDRWDQALATDGWNTVYFGNHDNPRLVSRFGDPVHFHRESATMLATLLLTLRGTPYLYQGDEIGMTNCHFEHVGEFDDVQVLNAYQALVRNGDCTEEQFMVAANRIARDHARTPMQWNDEHCGGFTKGESTWLKVNPNYTNINVENQLRNPNSILNYYKKLLQLRKATPALRCGSYQNLSPSDPNVWIFERTYEGNKLLIMCNFTRELQPIESMYSEAKTLLCNYFKPNLQTLQPFESRILEL